MEKPILSPTASTRILFVGDLHLGRLPSHAPAGLDARTLGPEAAWNRIVRWACDPDNGIHAVALAGDVVDGDNALFEAYGPLEEGVRDLIGAGIEVCAVAGNHDTQALPRLAKVLTRGFHLLGPKGTWSDHVVAPEGRPPVRLVGWSFPREHWDQSPLATRPPAPVPGATTLGLLHADLAGGASRYAPVVPGDLKAVGYRAWFLGHVHRPVHPTADGTPFYLGSASPLDPSETGSHGPVLVSVAPDRTMDLARIPLAPLRWEHLAVPCSPDPEATDTAILAAVEAFVRERQDVPEALLALGFRIRMTGRAGEPQRHRQVAERIQAQGLRTTFGSLQLFVDRIACEVTASYDLGDLARTDDPIGLLARQILALEDPAAAGTVVNDPEALSASLLDEASACLDTTLQLPVYRRLGLDLGDRPAARESLRRSLIQAGRRALDVLMASRGDDHAPA